MGECFHVEIARALLVWYSCADECNSLKKKLQKKNVENYKDDAEFIETFKVYKESLFCLMDTILEYELPEDFPVESFSTIAKNIQGQLKGESIDSNMVKTSVKNAMSYVLNNKAQLLLQSGWSK